MINIRLYISLSKPINYEWLEIEHNKPHMCLAQQEKRKKVYLAPKQSFKYLATQDKTSEILIYYFSFEI